MHLWSWSVRTRLLFLSKAKIGLYSEQVQVALYAYKATFIGLDAHKHSSSLRKRSGVDSSITEFWVRHSRVWCTVVPWRFAVFL